MAVCVPYKKLFVQSATGMYGVMEEGSFNARFAQAISVKTTSLSTRRLAKFWKLKLINASLVIGMASILA